MYYIIGIDIGTTGTKAIAYGVNNEIILSSYVQYNINSLFPTWCEQSPKEIFEAVLITIKNITNRIGSNRLLGIAFSSAMHSIIAVDERGNALTECIIWGDTRSKQYSNELKQSPLGKAIYNRTGAPIHPMLPLTKICWLRDYKPDIFNKTYKFIGIKEYVIYKLTGEYLIDYSIASATGLFDLFELNWNKAALEYAGIKPEQLSSLVPTEHVIKNLKEEYALKLNIDRNLKIVIGASDGCLANVGGKVLSEGSVSVTIGTSGAIRITTKEASIDKEGQLFSYILDDNYYVSGGAINNGGVILNWFKESFLPPVENEKYSRSKLEFDELIDIASKVSEGAEGLIFLPYLLGERAPHWDPDARGVFFGVSFMHRYEHFARAVIEGITFSIYNIGKILEENSGKIETIYAGGGFAVSEFWLQMLSDVFNKRVIITDTKESSGVGAAILGFKALGIIDSLEEGAKEIKIYKSFYPNLSSHHRYMKNYNVYQRLYLKLKDEFKLLGDLQQRP